MSNILLKGSDISGSKMSYCVGLTIRALIDSESYQDLRMGKDRRGQRIVAGLNELQEAYTAFRVKVGKIMDLRYNMKVTEMLLAVEAQILSSKVQGILSFELESDGGQQLAKLG